MLVWENKFTYFVNVFKYLIDKKLIEINDESVDIVINALVDINRALQEVEIVGVPRNLAVMEAFTYYTFEDNRKSKQFLKWAKENSLIEISDLKMDDIINIYDKIFDNAPKKIFMSMWFNEKTADTYKEVNDVKEIVLKDYNVELEIIKVDEHKDGFSEIISKRIIDGIDNCDLLIADLSYGNKNVHHEIGYAQGKGKKVLLLYHVREGTNPADEIGSNLSMHDQLRFNTYGELREKLLKKIKDRFSLW